MEFIYSMIKSRWLIPLIDVTFFKIAWTNLMIGKNSQNLIGQKGSIILPFKTSYYRFFSTLWKIFEKN